MKSAIKWNVETTSGWHNYAKNYNIISLGWADYQLCTGLACVLPHGWLRLSLLVPALVSFSMSGWPLFTPLVLSQGSYFCQKSRLSSPAIGRTTLY